MNQSNFALSLIKAAKQKEQRLKQAQLLLTKKTSCFVPA